VLRDAKLYKMYMYVPNCSNTAIKYILEEHATLFRCISHGVVIQIPMQYT